MPWLYVIRLTGIGTLICSGLYHVVLLVQGEEITMRGAVEFTLAFAVIHFFSLLIKEALRNRSQNRR